MSATTSTSRNIDEATGLFTADFYCERRWPEEERFGKRAGHHHGRFSETIDRRDRGKSAPCPVCGEYAPEVPGAPRVASATLPDGTKRKGVHDQAVAAELEAEAINHAWDSPVRAEIETEVYHRTKVKE